MAVNDVYAYFKSGANTFNPAPTHFPTSQGELTPIVDYAKSQGATLSDANALAMEVKMSWVETDGLAALDLDASDYITTMAEIPVYDFSQPPVRLSSDSDAKGWKTTGNKTAKMALIGMHVVGSAKGHPELIWATFEHVNNAPNDTYSYKNVNGLTKQVELSTKGPWLLFAKNAAVNEEHLKTNGSAIQLANGATEATATNTVRSFAWGGPRGDAGVIDNTEIIALNNAVLGMLGTGDIRKNYLLIGAIWTDGGVPGAEELNSDVFGSVMLSNSTMETFHQVDRGLTPPKFGFNCFTCHQGNPLGDGGGGLSHIWGTMKPLPPKK